MKHTTLILFICFAFKGICQYSLAGVAGQYYVDIVPDTLLNAPYNSSELYYIDINGDNINDIKLTSQVSSSPGGQVNGVSLVTLNNSTKLALGYVDSTYNFYYNFWITQKILKKYSIQDTIKITNFINTTSGNLGFYYYSGGTNASNYDWVSTLDKYVGVSYSDSNAISYGWINVNVPNTYSCKIKEYSLNIISTTTLEKDFSIEEKIYVFPSPTSDVIYLQSAQLNFKHEVKPVVYDLNGKQLQVPIQYININTYKMDVSSLSAGMYIVAIETENGVVRKKMIVEK